MKTVRSYNFVRDIFTAFGSAVAVSAAVEQRRMPSDRHLRAIGIDPDQFKSAWRG